MANGPGAYGAQAADPNDGWGPATSVRAVGSQDLAGQRGRDVTREPPRMRPQAQPGRSTPSYDPPVVPERGLPSWGALLLLLAIAGLGGLIDVLSGTQVRGGFNIGVVVASVVAILVVRRAGMFPIVIAPPIVYSGVSAGMLYIRSGGLQDKKVLFDAAANWLVFGFPAIAAATAGVLIIAGIRLIVRR